MKRFVGLISGGKDSFYTIELLKQKEYNLVALVYIKSTDIDSYMYQTVGHEMIPFYRQVLDVPIYIIETNRKAINTDKEYVHTLNDEVEVIYDHLYELQKKAVFECVSVGAIKSYYQYNRIKSVCDRLNLSVLTPLFNLDQRVIYDAIIECMDVVIVKVACTNLGKEIVGKNLNVISGMRVDNWCGEGGEYETAVLDAPFFKKKLRIKNYEVLHHPEEEDKERTVFFMKINEIEVLEK
ncbi:Rossmann-like alpha/beta/alpha sandwich fold containing protein [Trachipleistophora hominis]|uniref:Diphthine--ammonia ligase n=1 Tax=Trachipleistophora hominis TaxID=72359 RepID=L7JY72_TRAHO|nr:Rossmann-like alpha/beta/alpha sandwich fold containing protein [Trachipleistophora hominis]